jgi:DNA-binding MarR family transcriptional regulator
MRSAAGRKPRHAAGIEEQLFQALVLAADHLLQAEIEVLRQHDLNFPQYNVLRILRGARPDPLSCGAISERMLTRDSDLTRLLNRLTERRLVRRRRDPADRRIITAEITESGLQLLRQLDEPVRRVHRRRLRHLSRAQRTALLRLAELVRADAS